MNIPKEKLGVIGFSIKANRKAYLKKSKASKWTQAHFTKSICSQNTIINVERGNPARFIEYYDAFAKKLDLTFSYNPDVDEQIAKIIPKLYEAIGYYDIKKITRYTNKLLNILETSKNALWYCDVYKCVQALKQYYLNNTFVTADEFDYYIDVLDAMSNDFQSILKSFIFNCAYEDITYQGLENMFHELAIQDDSYVCNKLNVLLYYYAMDKTSKFLKQMDVLERELMESKNYARLLNLYGYAFPYLSYYDPEEAISYIEKTKAIIKVLPLSNHQKMGVFHSLGTTYYEMRNYEQALIYLLKTQAYDFNNETISFLYIASAQKKLGYKVEFIQYSEAELKRLPEDAKFIYQYLQMTDNAPAFVREKYIMEEILPRLYDKDEIVIGIFKDELSSLVLETNRYKDLLVFETKMKSLLEK